MTGQPRELVLPLLLLAASLTLMALLSSASRAERRRAARAAERRARAGTADQDAAALAEGSVREGWTDPTEGHLR
ncbi:hypothetical protein AB0G48_20910 [Streptomyces rubiginosohelvolus]|uniref:hypothetical protein n=1 Tax=Streptomyces rubiginosohelvolus TaxID=67362 RepID=UPI0033E36E38